MPFQIWNRRYTGSKYKLVSWIDEIIRNNCKGSSFCDIFAGTGVVAATEIMQFKKVLLNDFLHSNYIIYQAFFLQNNFDINKMIDFIYNIVNIKKIEDNFLSINYGGKYFSYNDAKIIGHIRNAIEENKNTFNEKEYAILLSSLIYSADKVANTVGHYDAYIKNKPLYDKFNFDFIKPYILDNKVIEIYRHNANELVKEIKSDIIYIDPPYNSRQYSRFYHILETITKWDNPQLSGTALKPPSENMSDYCRSSANDKFCDLIKNAQCDYLVVSYNNTYNSKSSSSRNKIELDDIINILNTKGNTKIFSKEHQYFNTGKTNFSDHKEFLFVTKVCQ